MLLYKTYVYLSQQLIFKKSKQSGREIVTHPIKAYNTSKFLSAYSGEKNKHMQNDNAHILVDLKIKRPNDKLKKNKKTIFLPFLFKRIFPFFVLVALLFNSANLCPSVSSYGKNKSCYWRY